MSPRPSLALALALMLGLAACNGEEGARTDSPPPEQAEPAPAETPDGVRILAWSDLIPQGEDPRPIPLELPQLGGDPLSRLNEHDPDSETGSLADAQIGTFNTLPGLDGEAVRLPGFVVPLDFEQGRTSRFLLVPYYGACIHVPPPPPNQTLYVVTEEPVAFGRLSQAVWVQGELETGRFRSEMGAAAYSLRLEAIEPYDGRFRG